MRHRLRRIQGRVKQGVAAMAFAAVAGAAVAQSGGNAADWYRKAIDRYGDAGITDAEWAALRGFRPNAGPPPSDAARAALARLRPVFSAMTHGARQAGSDFQLDYDQGFDLQLQHLGPLRELSVLMTIDATVRLHDGDAAGAANTVAAIYHVAGHMPQDQVLISSLVGQAIFKAADGVTQAGVDTAAFGPAESATMLEAVAKLGLDDPFGIFDAIVIEQDSVTGWMRDKYGEPEDRADMLDELSAMGFEQTAGDELMGLLMMEEAPFNEALDQSQVVLDRVAAAFEQEPDDAQFELAALQAEIEAGEHGPLAMVLLPNYVGLHKQMVAGEEMVTARLGTLRAIAEGDVPARAMANAAVWYVRAAQIAESMDPAAMTRLRVGGFRPADDVVEKLIDDADELIDTVRAGSRQPRCDFEFARKGRTGVPPWYLAGLRDAAQLLHVDAVQRLHAGEAESAADRLAIVYRLATHLAGERELFSTMTAHVIFNATSGITEWGLESFDAAQRAVLRDAARTMPGRDPFGYQRALLAERKRVLDRLRLPSLERRKAAVTVRQLAPDQVLFLVTVQQADTEPVPTQGPLADVISYAALGQVVAEAPDVRALGTFEEFLATAQGQVPDIGWITQRLAHAPSDLTRAWNALDD